MMLGNILSEEELQRYNRHILVKGIGEEGQQKLKKSQVLVVGAGGLGSPVAYYLAAAGIGRLGIIDSDLVEISNLQRQILHSTADKGELKVESARETLSALNPEIEIDTYQKRLRSENVESLVTEYDLVINCVDNFETRYLVNDICVLTDTPLVEAGVLGLEGQITLIIPGEGPCYRCIFPELSEKGEVPTAQQEGILGAVAGTIGTLQATEAIKYLLGIGKSLLLIYDARELSFREVEIKKNSDCSVCGVKD
jgi:adenylyltransferase/sulfurtransferase